MRTEKQEAFIEAFCAGNNGTQAAIKAGYSAKTARTQASLMRKKFANEIANRMKTEVADSLPEALAVVRSIMNSAVSDAIRLQAAKDILDRGGLKPTDTIEQRVTSISEKSTDELKKELEALLGTSTVDEIPDVLN